MYNLFKTKNGGNCHRFNKLFIIALKNKKCLTIVLY